MSVSLARDGDTGPPVDVGGFLDSLSGQACALDPEGTVVMVNREWNRFAEENGYADKNHGLGLNYLEICGRAAGEANDHADRLGVALKEVLNGDRESFLHAYPCHSPTENRWFQCQVTRLPVSQEGEEFLVLIQHVNISEPIRQLHQRTNELQLVNDAMQQFVVAVSHDLRAPLREMTGFGDLARQRYGHLLPETGQEYLGHIVDGGKRMRSLLDGLLSYVRATEIQEEPQPCDLNEILDEVTEDLEHVLAMHNVALQVGDLPAVNGYPGMLKLLFKNLIENAVKYRSEAPPHITVSARDAEEGVTFEVVDNGIGISPDYAKQAFRMFQRFHRADEIPGIGIGLALCRKIVEVHRGKIWFKPNEGRGSTFAFTIG